MPTQRILAGALVALAVVLVASRFRWSSLPAGRVEVSGTVFLDGSPLLGSEGTVVMGTEGEGKGRPVAGRIDGSGRYRVDTVHAGDGVAPGLYRVAVSAYRRTTSPRLPDGATPVPEPAAVPKKYEDPAKSGLTVEVTAQPRQTIDLQLKSE
jgi:hypothetical protein